jgi:3-amino-4-hydroxybenzoic acid synthase
MHMPLNKIQMTKRERLESPLLWFEVSRAPELLSRALQSGYTGVLLTPEELDRYEDRLTDRITKLVIVDTAEAYEALKSRRNFPELVLVSGDRELLRAAARDGSVTAFRAHVDDAQSLHDAIYVGAEHAFVLMSFKDPTNIPLELVIASLQSTNTLLIKEIVPGAMEDALVTVGVMEVGADGVLFTPQNHDAMGKFLDRWAKSNEKSIELQVGEIVEARPIGMGYRSCIDLATLFSETEGMLVGSTSQGGIFCCPEVFHLPYMELRPFRVNAGAIHSYVFNLGNKTDYMSELKAGSGAMVVDSSGKVRRAYVGRMKTEVRPLRLLEVAFDGDRRVNLLMQDDWHVRVYSDDAKPLNITELRPGHKVLGHVTDPGRHVGIKVSENILEK